MAAVHHSNMLIQSPVASDCLDAFLTDVPPKDDRASMELPLFALRAGELRVRVYQDDRQRVEIIPSVRGAATQRDKDVLLFCVSQLVSARNRGVVGVGRTVRTSLYAILDFCHRGKAGKDYARLCEALVRLRGTTVRTDRATGGSRIVEGFGLIESFRVVRGDHGDGRMEHVEITLSEWLYNAINATEVLTISREYFDLRSDLERRLYELARKHCGRQRRWPVGVLTLWRKSGSQSGLPEFRRKLRAIAQGNSLPDYRLTVNAAGDAAVFFAKTPLGRCAEITHLLAQGVARRGERASSGPVEKL